MIVKISVGTIRIGTIQNASALNIGRNDLREFEGNSKTNQGVGNISGDHNRFPASLNCVEDPDVFDMITDPSNIPDRETLEKLAELITDDQKDKPSTNPS